MSINEGPTTDSTNLGPLQERYRLELQKRLLQGILESDQYKEAFANMVQGSKPSQFVKNLKAGYENQDIASENLDIEAMYHDAAALQYSPRYGASLPNVREIFFSTFKEWQGKSQGNGASLANYSDEQIQQCYAYYHCHAMAKNFLDIGILSVSHPEGIAAGMDDNIDMLSKQQTRLLNSLKAVWNATPHERVEEKLGQFFEDIQSLGTGEKLRAAEKKLSQPVAEEVAKMWLQTARDVNPITLPQSLQGAEESSAAFQSAVKRVAAQILGKTPPRAPDGNLPAEAIAQLDALVTGMGAWTASTKTTTSANLSIFSR